MIKTVKQEVLEARRKLFRQRGGTWWRRKNRKCLRAGRSDYGREAGSDGGRKTQSVQGEQEVIGAERQEVIKRQD